MTTIDAADATCRGCAAPWRAGARFCPHCGDQAPPGPAGPRRSGPESAIPTQGWSGPPGPPRPSWPGPPQQSWAGPPQRHPQASWPTAFPPLGPAPVPEQPRSNRGLFVLAGVLALVAAVLGAFLVVGTPWSSDSVIIPVATTPTPVSAPPTVPLPADPAAALQVQRATDAAAAEGLVGSWAPQLSAKKQGLVVDGQTYDAATILADHQRLRGRQPDAILVWSGDYTSFRSGDFWITLADRPFASSDAANAWCASAGYGPDDCYAKRLSHTGGYSSHTALRSGTGSGSGSGTGLRDSAVPGGAAPVLGAASWAVSGSGFGSARPSEIFAGGDPTGLVTDVTWETWGGPQATGRGTASWLPPDAIVAESLQRPVIVAGDLGDCHGRLTYRSVGWYFPTEGETSLASGYGFDDICDF